MVVLKKPWQKSKNVMSCMKTIHGFPSVISIFTGNLVKRKKPMKHWGRSLKADSIYNLETAEKIYEESGLKAVIDWKLIIDIKYAESDYRRLFYCQHLWYDWRG